MIRSGHVLYDLREALGSPKLLFAFLGVTALVIFFINFQCVYGFVLLFGALIAARAMIGPRCPQCDGPLQEVEAERDQKDTFTLYVVWRCPRDGYQEKERVRAGAGLFGGN
jgi:hypothetical protein